MSNEEDDDDKTRTAQVPPYRQNMLISESGRQIPLEHEAIQQEIEKRQSRANMFDNLVQVNMDLVQSVMRLTKATYALMAFQTVMFIYMVWRR